MDDKVTQTPGERITALAEALSLDLDRVIVESTDGRTWALKDIRTYGVKTDDPAIVLVVEPKPVGLW